MVDNTQRDIPSVTLSIDGGINPDTDKIANFIFGQNIEISKESIHALTSQFSELLQNGHVMSSLDDLAIQMFVQAVQEYGDPEVIQALSGFAERFGLPIPELGPEATPESAPVQRMAIVGHGSDVVDPRSAPSDDVREMQQALVDAGFDVGSYPDGRPMVDGQEGALTRDAAMAAAEAMGISEEKLRSMPIDEFTQRLDEYALALENSGPQNAPVPIEPSGEPEAPVEPPSSASSGMSVDDAFSQFERASIPSFARGRADDGFDTIRDNGAKMHDGAMMVEFQGQTYLAREDANGQVEAVIVPPGTQIEGFTPADVVQVDRNGIAGAEAHIPGASTVQVSSRVDGTDNPISVQEPITLFAVEVGGELPPAELARNIEGVSSLSAVPDVVASLSQSGLAAQPEQPVQQFDNQFLATLG